MRSWSVVILLALLAGCAPQQQKELKPGEKAIILTGTVFPYQEAEVMSPISAIVDQILVEPGKKLKAGEVLLRLDPLVLRAEVARAEAALAMARAGLAEARAGAPEAELAEAQAEVERHRQELRRQQALAALPLVTTEYERAGIILENAKAKLERMYALFARRLVSKPEVEAAENEYAEAWRRFDDSKEVLERRMAFGDSDVKIAEARYKAARARLAALEAGSKRGRVETVLAQVRQAEADLARARYNLGQTTLKAPISGIVTEVMVQIGQKVYEGRPLVKIVDIARVKVKADLSPGLLPYVHIGQEAQVTVNTVPPTNIRASVDRIQPVADPKTQSLGLTLFLLNPEFKFQPGFTARVEIPVERGSSSEAYPAPMTLPTQAETEAVKAGAESRPQSQAGSPPTPAVKQEAKAVQPSEGPPALIGPPQPTQATRVLKGIRVTKGERSTRVSILMDGRVTRYDAFQLQQPPRFVLDLQDIVEAEAPVRRQLSVHTPQLRRIRIGRHPEKIRIVLDLAQPEFTEQRIVQRDDGLQVILGEGLKESVEKEGST